VFVTGALALAHDLSAEPPYQRIKPEHRFDHHVNRRREVVAPPRVTALMLEDGFELFG